MSDNSDIEESVVLLYPNPADRNVTVKTAKDIEEIRILTLSGKVMSTTVNVGSNEVELNVESLAPGIYMIHVMDSSDTYVKKLVIE